MEQSTNETESSSNSISLVDSRRILFEQIVTGDRDVYCVRKSGLSRSKSNGGAKVNSVNCEYDDVCANDEKDDSGDRVRCHRDSFTNTDESLVDSEDAHDLASCAYTQKTKIYHHDEDAVAECIPSLHSEMEMQSSNEAEHGAISAATLSSVFAINAAAATAAVCENLIHTENDETVAPRSVDDLNYPKRISYHHAVFVSTRPKLGDNVNRVHEYALSESNVGESTRCDRETDSVNRYNLDLDVIDKVVGNRHADNTLSENFTCSEDLINTTNINKSEPFTLISSLKPNNREANVSVVPDSSFRSYPEELNPFGEDDEEEIDWKKEFNNSTNPFGSESESENSCSKSEKTNTNPFFSGSDEEDEDDATTSKKIEELKTSPSRKTPVPLPRTVKTTVTPLSPQPSPRSHVKNVSSNEISPATSCHSLQSLFNRKLSSDSLEMNFVRLPSSVNSTLRKKKPAPPPPMRVKVSNDTNFNQDPIEEQIQKADNEISKSSSDQNTRKVVISPWKNKKGPAPARPIPLRRPVKEMPLEDIKTELTDLEIRQQELGRQSLQMEEKIRKKTEAESAESPAVEEMVVQLFEIVNEKNELFRRRSELINMRKMHNLEEEHAEIEYQIRCLMLRPERNKTDTDKTREEELIRRLLEVVEKRNEIIETMEKDRQRESAEDESVTTQLDNRSNSDENETRSKEKKKNKNKKSKFKGYNEGDGKGCDNDKHSPSKLIKQKFMTLRHTAKKLHPK